MKHMMGRGASPRLRAGGESGGVLVMALVSVVTVVVLGAAFLQVSSATTQRQVRAVDTKRAFYVAEAGLAESYAGLLIGKTGNVGLESEPAVFGDGLFWVETEDHADGKKTVTSTGMCGTGRAVLSVVVEPGDPDVASLGIFAEESLQIGSGVVIDAYDSRLGTYAEQVAAGAELPAAKVGSNGPVAITELRGDSTEVHGDLRPGPAQTLTVEGEPLITGSTAPLAEAAPSLPPVRVPAIRQDPGIRHSSAIPMLIQNGDVGLDYLEVAADSTVILQGPVTFLVDDLTVESQGELNIDTQDGNVVIIVKGELSFQSGSLLSGTGDDPLKTMMLVAGQGPVQLASRSPWYGAVYAPDGQVGVSNGAEIFGSVVGAELGVWGGAKVHYDLQLADAAAEDSLTRFLAWRIVDMSPRNQGNISFDPFATLGLDPSTLPGPSAAHEDQTISVTYKNDGGAVITYDGMESDFDWSVVKEVIDLMRDGEEVDQDVASKLPGALEGAVSNAGNKIGDFLDPQGSQSGEGGG